MYAFLSMMTLHGPMFLSVGRMIRFDRFVNSLRTCHCEGIKLKGRVHEIEFVRLITSMAKFPANDSWSWNLPRPSKLPIWANKTSPKKSMPRLAFYDFGHQAEIVNQGQAGGVLDISYQGDH